MTRIFEKAYEDLDDLTIRLFDAWETITDNDIREEIVLVVERAAKFGGIIH